MDVKEAVRKAIAYILDLFESENPENIGLEEIVLNESKNAWEITVGFSPPWDHQRPGIVTGFQPQLPMRQYKVVSIDTASSEIRSIRIRELPSA